MTLTVDAVAAPGVEQSVVKIITTQRQPDYYRPWTKESPDEISGSGVVIAGPRILTNAHVVSYASDVQVQLRKGGDKLPAKVTAIAPGIDLAIVELKDSKKLDGIEPLSLATELPQPKSSITVYGYPTGGDELSITDGIVSRIEYADYYYETVGVRIQVDAALNPGNSGGPAIQDGKIAGLVFSKIVEADNIGYLIPPEEIEAFMQDAGDGTYDGKLLLFDLLYTTENAGLRQFLKLPENVTGIMVGEPWKEDAEYPLKKWDVITHVGPHPIDNQGFVDVREGLRLKFNYFVPKLASDDKVELTIWRDGKSQVVQVPLQTKRDYLIPYLHGAYPDYFIYGPLCFSPATQELMRSLAGSGAWARYLLALDSPLLSQLYVPPHEKDEQLVVIASRLFPNPITKGYDNRPFGVVGAVNGTKVKNLRHLAELLRDNQEEFVRFEMADRSESFVFRADELKKVTEDVLVEEGIRYQASLALRDMFEDAE
ncbi:MAG: trypsin-like peptidase domain-containing protein [Pirellulales bacterium]